MKSYIRWGKSVSINLFDCDHGTLKNPIAIKKFVGEIIKKIDMKAHGPCYVDQFGIGKLKGYSAMQFIETSTIVVHCDDVDNRAFIDVFSCKNFDERKAEKFAATFFSAKRSRAVALDR